MLEGFLFLNIIIFIGLSIVTNTAQEDNNYYQLILSYISIGIAFIEFLVILVFHTWRHRLNLKKLYIKFCNNCNNTSAKVLCNKQGVSKIMDLEP